MCHFRILGYYLGNMVDVDRIIKTTDKIFADVLADWHKQYGPVVKFQFMNTIVLTCIDQEAIKQILVIKNYPKWRFFSQIIGFPFSSR